MMSSWSEDVSIEIEALQATYGPDLILNEPQQQVSMLVLPQQDAVEQQQQHYVQCLLLFTLPADYPSQAPNIHIQDAKGFINRQEQLQQQLAADAAELAGELLLGHLFEAAKTWLTENDVPEGSCIFCLDDLAVTSGSNSSSVLTGCQHNQQQQQTLRLPCFHAYHGGCFEDWWCWQQQAYMEQQKALEARTGATAAAALAQESLPPKDGSLFQLSCPTCRAPFQLQDLPALTQQQLQQRLDAQQQQQSKGSQQQQHAHSEKLTAAQLQPFLVMQQEHAKLFAVQQQRQGIIDTEASYCIADWEGPSSSSSSAEPAGPRGAAAVSAAVENSNTRAARGAAAAAGVTGASRGRGRGRNATGSRGGVSSTSGGSSSSRDRGRGRGRFRGQRDHLSDDFSRLDVSQQQQWQQQQQWPGHKAPCERQQQQQQQQDRQNHGQPPPPPQQQQQQERQLRPAAGDSNASQQHGSQQQARTETTTAQQQWQQRHGAPLHTDVQTGRHSMHRSGGSSSRGRGSGRTRGRGRTVETQLRPVTDP